ncbi:MAG: hypothetical protein WAT79_13075 [Saprospiraceae bacterium]
MKNYILLLCIFTYSCSSNGQKMAPIPCGKVHEGNFSKIDKIFGIYEINRSAKNETQFVQVEHVVKSKLKIEFLGIWTDDCTCELRFSKVLENGIGHDFETMLKDVIRTEKIVEINRDSTQVITEYKIKTTSNQHEETDEEIIFCKQEE